MTAVMANGTQRVRVICALTDFELTIDYDLTSKQAAQDFVSATSGCLVTKDAVLLIHGNRRVNVPLEKVEFGKRVSMSHVDITEDAFTFDEKLAVFYTSLCKTFGYKDSFHMDFNAYGMKTL